MIAAAQNSEMESFGLFSRHVSVYHHQLVYFWMVYFDIRDFSFCSNQEKRRRMLPGQILTKNVLICFCSIFSCYVPVLITVVRHIS